MPRYFDHFAPVEVDHDQSIQNDQIVMSISYEHMPQKHMDNEWIPWYTCAIVLPKGIIISITFIFRGPGDQRLIVHMNVE